MPAASTDGNGRMCASADLWTGAATGGLCIT